LEYGLSDIIPEATYNKYQALTSGDYREHVPTSGQASFERAYITTDYVETENKNNREQHLQAGAKLAQSEYTESQWTALSGKVAKAYVVTRTIQLSESELIFAGSLMTSDEKSGYITSVKTQMNTISAGSGNLTPQEIKALSISDEMKNTLLTLASTRDEINNKIVEAYYCTSPGLYGGNYYATTGNYSIQETLNSLSQTELDQAKFNFNYDALDLLIDPTYGETEGKKYQYDSSAKTLDGAKANPAGYSLKQSVDCEAKYTGSDPMTYIADNGNPTTTDARNILTSSEYRRLLNEQQHYFPITISNKDVTHYIVKNSFYYKKTYAAGQEIDADTYNKLKNDNEGVDFQGNVDLLTFDATGTYYYCREEYTIAEADDGGKDVASASGVTGAASGGPWSANSTVPVGTVITSYNYSRLTNNQKDFTIQGVSPVETSTFYVSRNSDIKNLSKDKIITVVYQYDYDEATDEQGDHRTPISELHVVNIHLQFKNGEPTLDKIKAPNIVLPGTSVTPKAPSMITGAYEINGGGWEM
jgi:hypothetical protein